MPYRIFKRKRYKLTPWGYFPDPHARSTTVHPGVATVEEAREICSRGPANVAYEEGHEYQHLPFYDYEYIKD